MTKALRLSMFLPLELLGRTHRILASVCMFLYLHRVIRKDVWDDSDAWL